MNRVNKEAARQYREAREGLSAAKIQALDLKEAREQELDSLTRAIHHEWFPEESDHMMDSISDARDRKRGINPMSAEYTESVNTRREARGVEPLGENGLPTTKKSWDLAAAEAKRRLTGL
ncbi:hypothetical protein [Saccharospirillum sp.]|uniref:hypothetical protein n=1 Tax=Saccharospirillum sp. TaxID=2033801 RepID=UPI00349FE888